MTQSVEITWDSVREALAAVLDASRDYYEEPSPSNREELGRVLTDVYAMHGHDHRKATFVETRGPNLAGAWDEGYEAGWNDGKLGDYTTTNPYDKETK